MEQNAYNIILNFLSAPSPLRRLKPPYLRWASQCFPPGSLFQTPKYYSRLFAFDRCHCCRTLFPLSGVIARKSLSCSIRRPLFGLSEFFLSLKIGGQTRVHPVYKIPGSSCGAHLIRLLVHSLKFVVHPPRLLVQSCYTTPLLGDM